MRYLFTDECFDKLKRINYFETTYVEEWDTHKNTQANKGPFLQPWQHVLFSRKTKRLSNSSCSMFR